MHMPGDQKTIKMHGSSCNMVDGYFNCVNSRIKALGWLEKKEEERKKLKKMNNSGFQPFQVGYFKIVSAHC